MKREQIVKMRKRGMTLQKIGSVFGKSRQRVHQKLTGYHSPSRYLEKSKKHHREYMKKYHQRPEVKERNKKNNRIRYWLNKLTN